MRIKKYLIALLFISTILSMSGCSSVWFFGDSGKNTTNYEFDLLPLVEFSQTDTKMYSCGQEDNLTSAALENNLINYVNFGEKNIVKIDTWRMSGGYSTYGELTRFKIYYLDSIGTGNNLRLMKLPYNKQFSEIFSGAFQEAQGDSITPVEDFKLIDIQYIRHSTESDDYSIIYYLNK